MGSKHMSEERIRQFMFGTLELNEDESEHISGWSCADCAKVMRKVVLERPQPNPPTTKTEP